MKKCSLWLVTALVFLCTTHAALAQDDYYTFFVTIPNVADEPTVTVPATGDGVNATFTDVAVNNIAALYTFRQFHRAFPNTVNPALENVFIVEVNSSQFMYALVDHDADRYADAHEAVFTKYYVTIPDSAYAPAYSYNNYISTVTFTQPDLNDLAADYSFTEFYKAFPLSTDPAKQEIYLVGVHDGTYISELTTFPGGHFPVYEHFTTAKFKIYVTNRSYVPSITTQYNSRRYAYSPRADVQNISSNYNISEFRQLHPDSYFEELRQVYYVECNSMQYMDELINYNSTVFPSGAPVHAIEPFYTPNDFDGHALPFTNDKKHHKYLELINAEAAWNVTKGDSSIPIGISDWHVNTKHPEIKPYLTSGSKVRETNTNSPNNVFPGYNNHGTAVFGTIAAATDNNDGLSSMGFNLKVGIKSHKKAETEAVDNLRAFAKNKYRVVNCSWGGRGPGSCMQDNVSDDLNWFHMLDISAEQFYHEMYERGMTIVFGAGNGGPEIPGSGDCHYATYGFPASYDYNISVTSVGSNIPYSVYTNPSSTTPPTTFPMQSIVDVHDREVRTGGATYPTQYGGPYTHHNNTRVDICAPGYSVHVLDWDPGDPSKQYLSNAAGTSLAAPLVTATAGLMLSANPCLTPYQVEYLLKAHADSTIYNLPLNHKYANPKQLGTGRLDAGKSVLMASKPNFKCNSPIAGTETMYIEEIKINHKCWGNTPATLTPVIRNGNGNYKYRWRMISNNSASLKQRICSEPDG